MLRQHISCKLDILWVQFLSERQTVVYVHWTYSIYRLLSIPLLQLASFIRLWGFSVHKQAPHEWSLAAMIAFLCCIFQQQVCQSIGPWSCFVEFSNSQQEPKWCLGQAILLPCYTLHATMLMWSVYVCYSNVCPSHMSTVSKQLNRSRSSWLLERRLPVGGLTAWSTTSFKGVWIPQNEGTSPVTFSRGPLS